MSEENVELLREMFEAWNRGDYDAARGFFDPDVEAECSLGTDLDGTYSGHAGIAKLMRFWGAFGTFRSDIERYMPVGDAVVMLLNHHATGKSSGIDVETSNWQAFTIRNRRIVWYGIFSTEARALEATRRSD